jgi:uncharacterized protein (TIGR02246 family)
LRKALDPRVKLVDVLRVSSFLSIMRLSFALLALVILSTRMAMAAEGDAPKPAKPSEESTPAPTAASPLKSEIADVQTAYADAYNKGDAKLLAALFTSDADWIDDQGTVIRGRAAIQRALQDVMGGQKDRTLKLRLDSIRSLAAEVVVGNALSTLSGGDRGPDSAAYIAVYVKQEGKWRIALLTETNEVEDDE